MSTNPDSQLIERCQRGDDEAFRELIEQHKRLVFALIARSIRDQARAEELAQEVFLRVYRGLRVFSRRGAARRPGSTGSRSTCSPRSGGRGRPIEVSLDEPAPGRDGPRFEPGAEDRAFGDLELQDRLGKAIERLPAQYQVLVNGHYLKGLRYEDLAEALGLPMGTVKTHLHRAKRLLRQMLTDCDA